MKTRRDFLQAAFGTSSVLLLAACAPAAPAAPTVAPAKPTSAPAAKPTTAPAAKAPAAPKSAASPAASPGASPATKPAASPAASPAAAGAGDPSKPVTRPLLSLEQELAVPQELVEAARREGNFSFISSIDEDAWEPVYAAFSQRYPGISVEYQNASQEVRTVRTLTEFKAGRNRIDLVMGVGGFMIEYRAADATMPLNELGSPAYTNYDPPFRDEDHAWVGVRTQFWGLGFNTQAVSRNEVPKNWEDLTDPKWRGRIGMANRPNLWAQHLWKIWGEERTTQFLKKLFANEPQRRKEGLNAMANLLAAGEFDLLIPAAPYRIQGLIEEAGAPVGWYSPEPLSVSASEFTMFRNSPSPNAAKLFFNWFLSREGQHTYAKADFAVPAHPDLRLNPEYLGPFAGEVIGKEWAINEPEDEMLVLPHLREAWNPLWTGA